MNGKGLGERGRGQFEVVWWVPGGNEHNHETTRLGLCTTHTVKREQAAHSSWLCVQLHLCTWVRPCWVTCRSDRHTAVQTSTEWRRQTGDRARCTEHCLILGNTAQNCVAWGLCTADIVRVINIQFI